MASIVRDIDVKEPKGYGITINQTKQLYLDEVMKERGVASLRAAIIEIFDDRRPPKVHLNDEVKIVVECKTSKIAREDVGKKIDIDLKDVKEIKWYTDDLDGNSGKIMLVRWNKDFWVLHFDFRYNQEYGKLRIERAKDFLRAAERLSPKEDKHALVYLLWSAVELIFDCEIAKIPGYKVVDRKHGDRFKKAPILKDCKNLDFESLYEMFLTFSNNKNGARYAEKEIDMVHLTDAYISASIKKLGEIVSRIV